MKIKQPKRPDQGQRWISCLKEPTFCQKSHIVKLAKKLRKKRTFEDKSGPKLVKNSHFLGQRWDHRSPYHSPTLGNVNWVNFLSKLLSNRSKVSSFSFIFQSLIFSISMSDPLLSLLMVCFEILYVPLMSPCFH